MRLTSPAFLRATNAEDSDQILVPLIELSHPEWPVPYRFVRDELPLVHQTYVYEPAAFDISLPDDAEEGAPIMDWSIDNTDLRLVDIIRSVRNQIYARVFWVLVSQPDFIEAGPFEVELVGAEYDADRLGGPMTLEPILDEPFGFLKMSPKNAPGLF